MNNLRTIIITRHTTLKELMISPREIEIVEITRTQGNITSEQVAAYLNISNHNACNILNNLLTKKYLDREYTENFKGQGKPTKGVTSPMYVYSIPPELRLELLEGSNSDE